MTKIQKMNFNTPSLFDAQIFNQGPGRKQTQGPVVNNTQGPLAGRRGVWSPQIVQCPTRTFAYTKMNVMKKIYSTQTKN